MLRNMLPTAIYLSLLAQLSSALPEQLFSPLIPVKVAATFGALPNPVQYPQYTDTTAGQWQYFVPNTWTSGFFPTTGYALDTRLRLCGSTPANALGTADWLGLARSASNGLLNLNASDGLGHDVGFISFPFIEELLVCVCCDVCGRCGLIIG